MWYEHILNQQHNKVIFRQEKDKPEKDRVASPVYHKFSDDCNASYSKHR